MKYLWSSKQKNHAISNAYAVSSIYLRIFKSMFIEFQANDYGVSSKYQ